MSSIWKTLKTRARKDKNWIYAAFACFSLMVVLNTDLSAINAEAASGGFWNLLAGNIKKLEYLLPVFTYRDAVFAFFIFFFFQKAREDWDGKISRWSYRVPAALTAFFLVFGYSFRYPTSWDLLFMDTFHVMVSFLMMI